MISAKKHPKELERIQALYKTEILDTISEAEYDEIVFLASHICKTPIALFSIVDIERQWFKAKVGLDANQTGRDMAFCAHAILQDDIFIINNSKNDPRFFDNPLVVNDPHVVFYAGVPVLDPESKLPLGTLCVIDNTERVLDEQQIKALKYLSSSVSKVIEMRNKIKNEKTINQKNQIQSVAIQNMQEGFVIQNQEGKIVDFNFSALRILGLTEDQILGKTSMDPDWQAIKSDGSVFNGDEHPAMITLKTGEAVSGVLMGIKTNNTQEKWIQINSSPLKDSNGLTTHAVTTFLDVTALRLAEEKLVESAKLKSLAEMAAGVAHEINNPLAIINGIASNSLLRLESSDLNQEKTRNSLQKIKETVLRISKIVKGLKSLSRENNDAEFNQFEMIEVVNDVLSVCTEKFKNNDVKLNVNLKNSNLVVHGSFINLGQILLNLLHNSFDAAKEQNNKWVNIDFEINNGFLITKVTDSGLGISAEKLNNIFMPFYTTKPAGKGTGLGLSISKSLAEGMNGRLFYSKNNSNTCFVLEVPLAQSIQQTAV